jgi:hypothetical protein
MSSFTPTQWTMQPPDRPDHLAAAVMQSLSRLPSKRPWRPLKTVILGGLTFGILPLLAWPKKFDQFVVAEQQQFWHLVEWLRIRTGNPEAAELKQSVRNTGARATVWLVPMVLLAWMVMQFVPHFANQWFHLRDLIAVTYGFSHARVVGIAPERYLIARSLFRTWTACLAIAYAFHWLHIRQHAQDVAKLLARINALLVRENVAPVEMRGVGIGINPLWLLAGALGVACGAYWAIPAALAGAVQQRYVCRTGPQIRGDLADRVRSLLLSHRPPMDVPVPVRFRLACPNPLCRAAMPDRATFCPRCGTKLSNSLDRLA